MQTGRQPYSRSTKLAAPETSTPTASVLTARWGGEMQLLASVDVDSGGLLNAEFPIAFVQIEPHEEDDAPMLLLESILADEATCARVVAEDLKLTTWTLGRVDVLRLDTLAQRYRRNPKKLAQLYHRVAANNIRYAQGEVIGYGIWPLVSRSNHSCNPNVRLGATIKHPLAELMLATRPIKAGEAICWNYMGDPAFLELGWFERNQQLLRDFQFLCRCPRCESERPAAVGAMARPDIEAYFARPSDITQTDKR